jgi:hypothetical protein
MVRFWEILEISSFAVGAIAFFYAVGSATHWFYTASLVPLPELGEVQEFSIRGKTVYITKQEQHEPNVAFAIAFVGAGLGGWIDIYKRRPYWRRPDRKTRDDEGSS